MISPFPPSGSRAALTAASTRDERVVRPQLGAKHTSLAPDTLSVGLSEHCLLFISALHDVACINLNKNTLPISYLFCTFSSTADHGSMVDKAGTVSDSGVLFLSLWW